MTRYVYAWDWETDACPLPGGDVGNHINPLPPDNLFPSGDRIRFMTCVNCGVVIWGHYNIEEEPWP